MLGASCTMSERVGECSVNNILLSESTFALNGVKDEPCQNEDFADDKVDISQTSIITDNAELQMPFLPDNMKHNNICTTWGNIKTELSFTEAQCDSMHDILKIEEGINADDIKIESNNRLLYCEDCHVYCEEYCAQCGMLVHFLNRAILVESDNTSQDGLPNNILDIQDNFGEFHVSALKSIPIGVRFGPFTGFNTTEHSWKIKGGKFIVNKDKSMYLNWMQYINPAMHISEQNLQVFQYEHNLYYESTRQIEKGNELLVYFGKEYEDSLSSNVEMNFIPTTKHIINDAFGCTFCCLGFSSRSYLAKHKAICSGNVTGEFSIEELVQCPSCKIHLDRKEYIMHHMAYCYKRNDRKRNLPASTDRTARANRCRYRAKYKGGAKNQSDQHCQVKMYKCGICLRRYKTKEVLKRHTENAHICADEQEDVEHSSGISMNTHIKSEYSHSPNEMKQWKCSKCEFRTKYRISLKRHVAVKHLKECKYKCEACDYKTNWKHNLERHRASTHLKLFSHRCDSCDYKANLKSQLDIHIETIHLERFKYMCDRCHYKTNRKHQLRIHIEIRHLKERSTADRTKAPTKAERPRPQDEMKPLKCQMCDFRTKYKLSLRAHVKIKHLREFKYKCDSCNYRTNVKSNLKSHAKTRHLKEFQYQCDACDYKTNRKYDFKTHMDVKHLKEFKHQCDTCHYKTNTKAKLKRHVKTKHLQDFKYKCDICDYKTNFKSNLKAHLETRHLKEFKYKCDTCDFRGNQKSNLKIHMETRHLKEFKYECDACDYKSNTKAQLKSHIDTRHLKEFKYKCDTCDYKVNRRTQLKTHVETKHLKEFKYKCDSCDYKANQKGPLKAHIEAKHLKEFKHKCDSCDYETNFKSALKSHVEGKHLKEFKHKCDTCDYKSNFRSALKRHIERKHLKEFKHLVLLP